MERNKRPLRVELVMWERIEHVDTESSGPLAGGFIAVVLYRVVVRSFVWRCFHFDEAGAFTDY